ncbi:MAG: TolC family protein [Calditrichaceae bacterium]
MKVSYKVLNKLMILTMVLLFTGLTEAQESNAPEMLTLDECIQVALEKNSSLKTSEYSNDASKLDELGSYEGILPKVNVSASKGEYETGPSVYLSDEPIGVDPVTGEVIYEQRVRRTAKSIRKTNNAGLSVDQMVFDGGNWWNQIRQAKANKRSSDLGLESDRNNVILAVQEAYFDLLKQVRLLEAYELAVQRSEGQLNRTQKMYELGATARLDVYRSQVNLGNDKISMLTQGNAVRSAKSKLNLAMGRDPMEPIKVQATLDVPESLPTPEDLIETAFVNQPLLKKNEADINSQKLSVSLAKSQLSPSISLYLNYDRRNEEIDRVWSNYDQNYTLSYGIYVSFNLFNGFSDYVNIQKAKIAKRTADENYEEYKRNLKSTIYQYYDNYKSYLSIIEINRQNLEASKEELRLAEERYQIGAGTTLDVREAQVNLMIAEQTLIESQYNSLISLAQIDNQLGLTYEKMNN